MVLRKKIIIIYFLHALIFSTQIHLHVLMEVSVSTKSCATAVDLMRRDRDARQVCKERNLTGFLGLHSCSHCCNDCSLPKGSLHAVAFSPSFLLCHYVSQHVACTAPSQLLFVPKNQSVSQVTLLLLVYNTGAERDHICRTWGQYNFETFDGLYYYFSGKSTYALVRHAELDEQSFSIQVGNGTSMFH